MGTVRSTTMLDTEEEMVPIKIEFTVRPANIQITAMVRAPIERGEISPYLQWE